MGLIEKIAQIDKKFSWSFYGFLLAAIFGGIAIYTEFVRDTRPVIKYEILSNTKILDVKEDVSGLSILYNGEDIRKARKTLSVLVVRVSNEGRSPILKSYYDGDSPLGFSINSGEVIKAEIIAATTDYLRANVGIRVRHPSNVEFSKAIIEPTESFTVKSLILNSEQSALSIVPEGKIASVKNLLLTDRTSEQTKETFLMKVVSGSIWVQVLRIPTYVIAFILLLLVVFMPAFYISDKKNQIKKNRIIKRFKRQTTTSVNEFNTEIYKFYQTHGLTALRRMRKALANNREFQTILRGYEAFVLESNRNAEEHQGITIVGQSPPNQSVNEPAFTLESMLALNLISKAGDTYSKNEERIKAMNEFIQFAGSKKT